MKFRYFTDAHMEKERAPYRPYRYSEMALDLMQDCLDTCPEDASFVVFGGDAIQLTRKKGREHIEGLMREFGEVAATSPKPFKFISGNHELDYFKELSEISDLLGLEVKNEVIDTDDGHRLIFIHNPFHAKGTGSILPFTQEVIDFVKDAVEGAPTKSVTLFSHTPLDHTDEYEMKVLLRDGDPEYCFRPNTKEIVDILEQSGKNCLVVSGHSHFEGVTRLNNVIYMTVQSLVEGVRTDPDQVYARWADFTRIGEDQIHVQTYGYKPTEYNWTYRDYGVDSAPLLAAE